MDNPDEVQERLVAEIPFLTSVRQFSHFVDHAQEKRGAWLCSMILKLGPVDADSVGNWRGHLARVKGQLLGHADISEDLVALGFEQDKAWFSSLDAVEPDLRPSAAIERLSFGKRVTRVWRNMLGTVIYLSRRYLGLEFGDTGETVSSDVPTPRTTLKQTLQGSGSTHR